jgi:hypothetical protein
MRYSLVAPTSHLPVASTRPPPLRNGTRDQSGLALEAESTGVVSHRLPPQVGNPESDTRRGDDRVAKDSAPADGNLKKPM